MDDGFDPAVAGNSQQTFIGNCSVVDLDVGELGDGGRLEKAVIIQPGVVQGQEVDLAIPQGGQAAAMAVLPSSSR